jgi:hypothetical protein
MPNRSSLRTAVLVVLALGALAAPLAAQDRGRGGPPHGGPPPEALAACTSHVSGAACSFTGREGQTLRGTCVSPSSSLPLACMPAGGPPGAPGRRGPPPEALSACSGIDVGDACAVDTPRGDTLEGTCRATPDGTACVPAHAPDAP